MLFKLEFLFSALFEVFRIPGSTLRKVCIPPKQYLLVTKNACSADGGDVSINTTTANDRSQTSLKRLYDDKAPCYSIKSG